MKLKIALTTLAVILTTQSVWAQSAADLVQRDVAKSIKTLSRETRFYHYFTMPDSNKPGGSTNSWLLDDQSRKSWVLNLFESRAGAFWDLNNHNTVEVNAGPGLYMALEPSSSRKFGDTIVTLDAPQASKYITTVSTNVLKPDTLAALVKENVIRADQIKIGATSLGLSEGLTAGALKNMVLPGNEKFRVLVQNVFQNLGIKFIEYGYKSQQNGFCKGGRLTAFIFIGSKPDNQTAADVKAVVDAEFKKQNMVADYLVGFFPEPLDTLVRLTMKYREAITEIRATAMLEPKVVNWPKALTIIDKHLSREEAKHLRDISFECKTP